MRSSVTVGKHTLESLTSGMYATPRDFYREYIQNSADALDAAVSAGIIQQICAKIRISINKEYKYIHIEDNGAGIPREQVLNALSDIGNSRKIYTSSRGFRGIGRLAGLSYCKKLTFETSAYNEPYKSIFTFDCDLLKEMLVPGNYSHLDMSEVISAVTTMIDEPEAEKEHYFRVKLESVTDLDSILDYSEMKDYLSQVAPLPFNTKEFSWAKIIHNAINSINNEVNEYTIVLEEENSEEQLFKLYSDLFIADKFRRLADTVHDIEIREFRDANNVLQAIGWISISNSFGSILDERKKGLRLRKGNLLIGDRNTLNGIFKESRFNGWFQGEVYVVDPRIMPNARRDNFENNAAWRSLHHELVVFGEELSRMIRVASASRNIKTEMKRGLSGASELQVQMIDNTQLQAEDGALGAQEEEYAGSSDELYLEKEMELTKRLSLLSGLTKGITKYAFLNTSHKLTVEQKKMMEKIFDIINELNEKESANIIIERIMNTI